MGFNDLQGIANGQTNHQIFLIMKSLNLNILYDRQQQYRIYDLLFNQQSRMKIFVT